MSAAPDIVGMENIETDKLLPVSGDRHAAVRLGCEEASSCFHIKKIFLRKGLSLFNNLIPQGNHFR